MSTAWKRKDLLTIRELERSEIELILDHARTFKDLLAKRVKKSTSLEGRTVVNLFVEPSTRTRTSFELAATRLDADVVSIDSASSSFRKGETLKDTGQVLEAMKADFVVLRHSAAGAPQFLAERLNAHVINAGDGAHEHPTQALLDTFTMRERLGDNLDWSTLHVVICGDILFSRVARSNVWALRKLGARVTLVGPTTLVPELFAELGVTVAHDLDSVLPDADVIMLLRIQHERQQRSFFPSVGEYVSLFGLNMTRFQKCKPNVLIMHPGPINRGVEIASELADGPNSTVLDQVQNGLAVRMAVLHLLGGGRDELVSRAGRDEEALPPFSGSSSSPPASRRCRISTAGGSRTVRSASIQSKASTSHTTTARSTGTPSPVTACALHTSSPPRARIFQDDHFVANCRDATAAGIVCGAYHYFRLGTSGLAQAQKLRALGPARRAPAASGHRSRDVGETLPHALAWPTSNPSSPTS